MNTSWKPSPSRLACFPKASQPGSRPSRELRNGNREGPRASAQTRASPVNHQASKSFIRARAFRKRLKARACQRCITSQSKWSKTLLATSISISSSLRVHIKEGKHEQQVACRNQERETMQAQQKNHVIGQPYLYIIRYQLLAPLCVRRLWYIVQWWMKGDRWPHCIAYDSLTFITHAI